MVMKSRFLSILVNLDPNQMEAIRINISPKGQNIVIPNEMRIDDDQVYLKKVGNVIYLIPFHNPWQNLEEGAGLFSDDFMQERIQPDQDQREML